MIYHIEVSLETKEEFSQFLSSKIKEYNNLHSRFHRESREKGAVVPINIMASDDLGNCIGGISAEVYWGWVEINDFWFQEEFRSKGLGSKLLTQVEEVSKEKGATKALLTTFDFQARFFYEKRGYKIAGEIKDYPPGSSYYTMVKQL
ncbi:GNAT family N-acetyltransferase [Anaerobacillus alkaliphilus]|uniref:GNAT family N-acetyltransferase n=1 Tax=Anaerobacillus alkaliphilus TaxID=1548597 RepID=A0A4Q0VRQ9_9BACI|nr:GNAT family N-acetyltransferase [Anaerobacillus alkaliphilus]RXJ00274.1 GNAT family N-acetyltransferase [Anaerobacillus alkaliphilus]